MSTQSSSLWIVEFVLGLWLPLVSTGCATDLTALNPAPCRTPTQFIRNVGLEFLIKVGPSHSLLGRCLTRLVAILCLPGLCVWSIGW